MKNKKNFLFALIGAGTLVLSAGVGFAAWTINITFDNKTDSSLKLSADATVNDNRIVLDSNKTKWDDNSVEFKPVVKATYTGQGIVNGKLPYNWLTVTGNDAEDNLRATYHVEGTAPKGKEVTITAEFGDETVSSTETDTKTYAEIVNLGAKENKTGIVANVPTPSISDNGKVTANEDTGNFTADVTLQFAWGDAFGGVNPYEYYNKLKYTAPLGTEAMTNIGYLQYLPKCSFNLTVKVSIQ